MVQPSFDAELSEILADRQLVNEKANLLAMLDAHVREIATLRQALDDARTKLVRPSCHALSILF